MSERAHNSSKPLAVSISLETLWRWLAFMLSALVLLGFLNATMSFLLHWKQTPIRLLDLDQEANFPSFFSALGLLFISVLIWCIAQWKTASKDSYKYRWLLLGVLFFLLSIDELTSIHELFIKLRTYGYFDATGIFHFVWVIPGTIFVAALGFLYAKMIFSLPPRTRYMFLLSAALYLSGALGMEMVNGAYASDHGQDNYTYALMACVEEGLEVAGILLFSHSLIAYIRNDLPPLRLKLN